MILVTTDDVGVPAWERMVRHRIVLPLAPGVARPPDVPDSPGLRALAAAPLVPAHVALTGLAALWVHGWRDSAPGTWHGVGARGLYRPALTKVRLHSGATARCAARLGPLRIAPPARACLDALRWEPPAEALAALMPALGLGRLTTDDLHRALAHDGITGNGYARLTSLVDAVSRASCP